MKISRALIAGVLLLLPVSGQAAITIQFDYTYDTTNFFSGANISRRAILDAAANVYEQRLAGETFGAIVPSGGNTFSLSFPNPATGTTVTLANPVIPANTVTIYAGARDLSGTLLGHSDYQYNWSGNSAWANMLDARDSTTNFDSFGGAIAFDSPTPWYFDSNPLTLESFPGQYDLYTVAQHEIAHLLGFTTGAVAFDDKVSGTTFTGANVAALYGGPAPLASVSDLGHFQQGLLSGSKEVLMDPNSSPNQRRTATELDFAVFKDLGYNVSTVPEPASLSLLVLSALALRPKWKRRPAA